LQKAGIGGQLYDLDGQMLLPALLDGLLGWNHGPMPRELDWIELLLVF
jgi:hypothetical protein